MDLFGFDIAEELGGGGEHCFWRARRQRDGRPVLLRRSAHDVRARADGRAMFERELEISRGLDVDGVLPTLELADNGSGAVLVLADAPGLPLDELLRRRGGALPLATALTVGCRLAGILDALHRQDLVHRDLRPANVVVDEAGDVGLTGLGRASRVPRQAWRIRAPDRIEGDAAYLAPEATGRLNRQLDYRADFYALGVVLFEMLSGRLPFEATDLAALIHAHIAGEPPDVAELIAAEWRDGHASEPPKVLATVARVVNKLLAKAAEDRYQSGFGLAHDLEHCLAMLRDAAERDDAERDGAPFRLGERDIVERFELSQALFGREAELRWLDEALALAGTGRPAVRLVAGFSGVGKTALIEEARVSVLRQHGWFASGTFDPSSAASPYAGVLAALRGLVVQQLGAGSRPVRAWRQRLEAELGPNLGVMTEALPELLGLVGEPPPVPEVAPENARNRFLGTVGRFLTTLTTAEDDAEPPPRLVLFLDDLQWVDAASVELLTRLLTLEGGAWLLVGAYRDNEVDEDHPLPSLMNELVGRGVDVDTLRLAPLGEEAVTRLVAETLRLPCAVAMPLGALVYRKTAGNPFFVRTFMRALHQHGLLRFIASSTTGGAADAAVQGPRWDWDLEAISSLEAAENVVDLVAGQLTELSPAARHTIAVAAILGKEFDAEVLAAACAPDAATELAASATEEILVDACQRGLVIELGDRYGFVHDRVREGAYGLLDEEDRAAFHLRIGRLLRAGGAPDPAESRSAGRPHAGWRELFEVADHLNQAAHLITDRQELRELMALNVEAGRQARASGAFPAAHAYWGHALTALARAAEADLWQSDYEQARTLHVEAAEAAALAGELETAGQLTTVLRSNARSLLDAVPAYETEIYALYAQREEAAALHLSLKVLARLGLEIPLDPTPAELQTAIASADVASARVLAAVEEGGVSALPALGDPKLVAASRILMRAALIANWPRLHFTRIAACRLVELSASHGVDSVTPIAYEMMAELRCAVSEDIAGGRRIGELGLAIADRPDARRMAVLSRILFDMLIGVRTVHPATLEQRFAKHLDRGVAAGDLHVAGASGLHRALASFLAGDELVGVETLAGQLGDQVQGFGQLMIANALHGLARHAAVLRGQETVEWAIDMADVAPGAVESVRSRLIGPEMMVRLLLRQRVAAQAPARESLALPEGILPIVPFDFYRCLIFLDAEVGSEPGSARGSGSGDSELDACRRRLERQAEAAPEIYQHKLTLVEAHAARAAGRSEEALELYQLASEGARQNAFPHEAALANELTAELYLEQAQADHDSHAEQAAARYLDAAVAGYRQWGAHAKVDQLFETYPDLLASPEEASRSLDVTTLERAQRALAGELDLSRLLRRLMSLMLQNAGARRGFLIRQDDDELWVEACGLDGDVELPRDLALERCRELAATVVRTVARSGDVVVVGDARSDPRFASDPYIARAQPRSILCFPLLHRGQAVELVYLENDRSPDAFSTERSQAVRLIGSLAGAVLRSARLHHSLEQEIEIRRQAEAKLAALKDRLQAENVYLRQEIRSHFEEIVGDSEAMRKVLFKVEQVAATDATVLVLGETGTGKELIARALHRLSPRRERPLVKLNCAALPSTLVESELFGHEKGAFTGALNRKAGRFELADGGTLFLDEIGDLPLELQAKLLRVLQEGELERLGGTRTLKVDVRIIAATNRNLEQAMAEGSFRADLYYRLTVFPIELPPLRERHGDVPLLVTFFLDRKRAKLGRNVDQIRQEDMERFSAYGWPGNVRELENVVERALILSPGETLELEEAFGGGARPAIDVGAGGGSERLEDNERSHIRRVLEACDWKVKGAGNAAHRLGLTPPTLRNRMKKLGITRPV